MKNQGMVGIGVMLFCATSFAEAPSQRVCFQEQCFQAEVVSTPEDLARGLMFRQELPPGQAMLFIFDRPDVHSFWMKNMKFPIDILWLDQDKKIVDIFSDVPPCAAEPCLVYTPSHKAVYVLEVPSDTVHQSGLALGAQAEF